MTETDIARTIHAQLQAVGCKPDLMVDDHGTTLMLHTGPRSTMAEFQVDSAIFVSADTTKPIDQKAQILKFYYANPTFPADLIAAFRDLT